MKKLVLSVTLGMFCYCTNNATMSPKTTNPIDYVLKKMIIYQNLILQFKEKIKGVKGEIYSAIKGKGEKINKKNVLDFIKKIYTPEEQKQKNFDDNINKIEQYFHLDKLNLTDECKEENLTEIFWTAPENKLEGKGILTDEESIKDYFNTIIAAETQTSEAFKEYYAMKKKQKPEAQDEDILKEIMEDCCGEEQGDDSVTKFIGKLKKMEFEEIGKEAMDPALTTIKKRITLSNNTEEEEKDFKSFLKQKIGIEEGKKAEEEYPCCNC